jgi:hypothetical protein
MSKKGTPFNAAAVSRVTHATARIHGGKIPAGSLGATAQKSFAKASTPVVPVGKKT